MIPGNLTRRGDGAAGSGAVRQQDRARRGEVRGQAFGDEKDTAVACRAAAPAGDLRFARVVVKSPGQPDAG